MKKSLWICKRRACAKREKITFTMPPSSNRARVSLVSKGSSKDYARRFNIKSISAIESRRDVESATTDSNKAANSIKIKCTPRQHTLNAFPSGILNV